MPIKSKYRRRAIAWGGERLEERWTPAQFGIPWPDPGHLTVSFVPDGTAAAVEQSDLFSALDAQMPRETWQRVILKAAQAWSDVSGVNFGVTSDSGDAFGVSGRNQADPRFGDIRIGGLHLDPSVMAVSVPPSSSVSGTYSGDIFINTNASFTPDSLFSTALHEFGHTLGLDNSDNPDSVMYAHLNGNDALHASDIAGVRQLYGVHDLDFNESKSANDSASKATRIKFSQVSGGYDGTTPVVAYGDLSSPNDVDFFLLNSMAGYSGPMTIRLQTQGISLLQPEIALTNKNGVVIAGASTVVSDAFGNVLTLHLPQSVADSKYYIRVTAQPDSEMAVGRYGIGVTFDDLLKPTAVSLDAVLRGAYETVPPEKIDQLFKDPSSIFFDDDIVDTDTTAGAIDIKSGPGQPNPRNLNVTGSLTTSSDIDFYRVRVPENATRSNWVMTSSLVGIEENDVVPVVEVYNSNMVLMPSEIMTNGDGTYSVQTINVQSKGTYFLRVLSPEGMVGNYSLTVNFGTQPAALTTFAEGAFAEAGAHSYDLYIGRTQLFALNLGVTGIEGEVAMTILNDSGEVVLHMSASAGAVQSSYSKLLPPGKYSVSFHATGALSYRLKGIQITDPIGPVIDSATLSPQYQSPTDPDVYVYPNGLAIATAYLWLLGA